MRDNNTHKNAVYRYKILKMIGRCFKLKDRYSTSLRPMALTVKLTRQQTEQRLNTVKLKILNHQKRPRENTESQ